MKKYESVGRLARECVGKMADAANQLPWEDKATYAQFLAQTFFYVRHATRVLATAASRCDFEQERLHLRLLDGITEEKGHEILAVRDLKALGFDIKDFSEFEETSCYYQTLYYKIQTEGPFALPGYFIPLEGLAAIAFEKPMSRVFKAHGKAAASFIEMHCVVDAGHFDEGLKALEHLPEHNLDTVAAILPYSTELYVRTIHRIANSKVRTLKRAA